MSKKVWSVLVLVLLIMCTACNDTDDVNVVEPDRLEYVDPTATPIPVGGDGTTQLIQDTRDARARVDKGLEIVNDINCWMGFGTCVTETSVVTYSVELWGND